MFTGRDRLVRYLLCIGIGLPTWFVIGILATFSNEFSGALSDHETLKPGLSIMLWCYIGLSAGDLLSGFLSHWMQSRKKAVLVQMLFTLVFSIVYLFARLNSPALMYTTTLFLGFGIGYWAMFVTISAEQFGTNLRATVATTVPNMVRGSVVLMTSLYGYVKGPLGVQVAARLVGFLCFAIGIFSTLSSSERHNKDLNFLE